MKCLVPGHHRFFELRSEFGFLLGSEQPFTQAQLDTLYPSAAVYQARWRGTAVAVKCFHRGTRVLGGTTDATFGVDVACQGAGPQIPYPFVGLPAPIGYIDYVAITVEAVPGWYQSFMVIPPYAIKPE